MPEIILTYRRTSRLSIRIGKRGEIRVSAPHGTSKTMVMRFVEDHREWIEKTLDRTREQIRKREDFYSQLPLKTKQEKEVAMARLNAIVQPLIEKYSQPMGVHPSAVTYRATISKWGSCNSSTRSLQFSTYLLLLPQWCIEHVVVHELAHLIVPNHSPKFYAVMDCYFPRWREARAETRRLLHGGQHYKLT